MCLRSIRLSMHCGLMIFSILAPSAVAADDAAGPNRLTLDEALTGATAITSTFDQYLFVARPDGGYVCAINMNDRFFSGILQDPSGATAFANRPGAVCVTARLFEDLAGDAEKL